jgi:hypothetical protein
MAVCCTLPCNTLPRFYVSINRVSAESILSGVDCAHALHVASRPKLIFILYILSLSDVMLVSPQ